MLKSVGNTLRMKTDPNKGTKFLADLLPETWNDDRTQPRDSLRFVNDKGN